MDEFDKSLEQGFEEEISFIIEYGINLRKGAFDASQMPEVAGK
jgi:superfamily II DNA/RNA helicase